ncbi:MAG TPA: transporter, partial [Gemmatimonadales bacterium]|nr:transporter [Gemmatimonadales bacterium]
MAPRLPQLVFLGLLLPAPLVAQHPEPAVADNSFLIEEAYNQEPGVVQHINAMAASGPDRKDLFYTFTQEWPFLSQKHQLSYTVPVTRLDGQSAGIGDLLLNYRLQLGAGEARWAFSPRLSAVLPTGKVDRGLGDGTLGVQANLPFSYQVTSDVVTHWNAGLTLLPSAKGPKVGGDREHAAVVNYNI